jgi:hypothetical protein
MTPCYRVLSARAWISPVFGIGPWGLLLGLRHTNKAIGRAELQV